MFHIRIVVQVPVSNFSFCVCPKFDFLFHCVFEPRLMFCLAKAYICGKALEAENNVMLSCYG